MPTAISSAAVLRARKLRRGMTQGERKPWAEFREFRRWYGIHVRRQSPIGAYITDFMIHEHRVVIEVDGHHHLEPERIARDRARDEWLAGQGYRVLRFNTGEIAESFDGCVEEILRQLRLLEVEKNGFAPEPSLSKPGKQ